MGPVVIHFGRLSKTRAQAPLLASAAGSLAAQVRQIGHPRYSDNLSKRGGSGDFRLSLPAIGLIFNGPFV